MEILFKNPGPGTIVAYKDGEQAVSATMNPAERPFPWFVDGIHDIGFRTAKEAKAWIVAYLAGEAEPIKLPASITIRHSHPAGFPEIFYR